MANTLLAYGKFEKVTIDVAAAETLIGGVDSFEIGIDERSIIDVPRTFDDGRLEQIVDEKNIRSWSLSGFYLTNSDDAGWNELQTRYNNAEISSGEIGNEDIDGFDEVNLRDDNDPSDTPQNLFSGYVVHNYNARFERDPKVIIRQTRPLPVSIAQVLVRYKIGGSTSN